MESKHAFRVGVAAVFAVVIVFYTIHLVTKTPFRKGNTYQFHIVFDDVKGLGMDAEVRLAGVPIGRVSKVEVRKDGKAMVTVAIDKKQKILRKSQFSIQAGFLQDKTIDIEALEKGEEGGYIEAGDTIEDTVSPASLEDLAQEAQKALGKVNTLLNSFNSIVADDALKQNILQIAENLKMTTDEAHNFAALLADTGEANRSRVDATIENVQKLTENLNKTVLSVDELIKNANNLVGDEEMRNNVKELIATLKETSQNIKKVSETIADLVTDEHVQEDVRETIRSTRKAAENADRALKGFTNMLEAINNTEFRPDFFLRYEGRKDKYFADMNVRVFPPKSSVYYMLGLDDVSERSTTNLMLGVQGARPDLWYRFGLKSGKLGLGMDWGINDHYYLQGDLIDPNDLTLDVRAGRRISESLYMLLGVEGITDEDSLSVGIYQKY